MCTHTRPAHAAKEFAMKIAATICRYLLAIGFLFFGLNGFFQFLHPQPMAGPGGEFIGLLVHSRYLYFLSSIEILSALFFLTGRYVRLGLLMLGPVLVNILIYHISFDPKTIGGGVVFSALWWVVFLDDKAFKAEVFARGPVPRG